MVSAEVDRDPSCIITGYKDGKSLCMTNCGRPPSEGLDHHNTPSCEQHAEDKNEWPK